MLMNFSWISVTLKSAIINIFMGSICSLFLTVYVLLALISNNVDNGSEILNMK